MPSNHELFFSGNCFAIVGHSKKKNFPNLTYQGLKKLGKTVYPVDPTVAEIEGDTTYPDLSSLPEPVNGVVLEIPKEETKSWIEEAARKGIKNVWIHMGCDTPEALELAEQKGINVRSGTCAVMYVTPGLSVHSIHKFFRKMSGRY